MDFHLLGHVEVISGEGAVVPLPPLKRRLLGALLLSERRTIAVERLMLAVWGDTHARKEALKTHVSELRLLVPGRIPPAGPDGYRLRLLPGDTVDVDTFHDLVATGERLAEAGEHRAAVASLREALNLWGADPLADVPTGDPRLRQRRQALLRQRQDAMVLMFETRLALGHHREIVADLRGELEDSPDAESLHVLLVNALYRSGQRVPALQHADAAAGILLEENGDPGERLRRLRAQIEADGTGPAAAAGAGGAATALPAVPAQLPPDVLDFTGRSHEVERLTGLLTPAPDATGVPIVGISGLPGIGKSALAIHVAHRLRPRFPDGQLFVHLAGRSGRSANVGEMLAELLATLGVPAQDLPPSTVGRAGLLRSVLAGRRVLIVVDDAAGVSQASHFLPGTAGCAVIITGRALLNGAGIRSFPLQPLRGEESLTLLGEIVGTDRVRREPEATRTVLEACGGLPLALRIAGSRLSSQPHWPVELLASRLQDRLKGLADGDLAVEASIAESYEALSPPARHAFRVLALAGPGDWPMWLTGMLLGAEQADDALAALTSHSLLSPAGADDLGHPRYRQHDLVRDFAEARLAEHVDEWDTTMNRLLLGWLLLADRASAAIPGEPFFPPPARLHWDLHVPVQAQKLIDADPGGWLARECAQLLAVIRAACEENRYRQGYGIALRLASHLYRAGRDRDAEDMWRIIMRTAAAAGDRRLAAEARHRMAALITRGPGGPARALPMLDTCVAVFAELVDRNRWARSLALRAFCAYRLYRDSGGPGVERAARDAGEALELARLTGEGYTELVCLRTLGLVASASGHHAEAIDRCEAALARGRAVTDTSGDAAYEVFAAVALATVLVAAGEAGRALAVCETALDAARGTGHAPAQAALAERAGDALSALGRAREAAQRYGEAVALCGTDEADPHRSRYDGKLGRATSGGGGSPA
ncbi:BTAD domain-containing putative transcriptional regulator [Streptosporangium sp. NPDC050855]|uniref:AfsR/SARP family transcriptional regulator n=1 Tax=Streptosporangium sp. NPDC050855 TaxID=3366194 RepID=UPI0037AE808D